MYHGSAFFGHTGFIGIVLTWIIICVAAVYLLCNISRYLRLKIEETKIKIKLLETQTKNEDKNN